MNGRWQLPDGYEDLLRAGAHGAEPAQAPVPSPLPSPAHLTPESSMDVQQLSDMLDAQFRLREAAQAGRAQALRALITTAETLCPAQWDAEKRAGHNPEQWTPDQIGEFVVRHILPELQRLHTAQQPDLAAENEQMSRALTAVCEENGRLKLQLQAAQALARTAAEHRAQSASERQVDRPPRRLTRTRQVGPRPPEGADEMEMPVDTRELDAVPVERVDAVIRLMASTGLARSEEIREHLARAWGAKRGSSRVGLAVRAALHYGLVEAFGCTVEWPGERTRQFLVLTPAGRARAVELEVPPVQNEYETGMKLHKTAEHLYLVLKTADVLRAEGFQDVNYLPECFQVGDGQYCPDIAAHEAGALVHIECERSQDKAREVKWSRAAQANGGIIRLVTPNRKIMDAITSEIKATTGSAFKIWAFNISEYAAGVRGLNGSIWTHQR